MRPRFEIAETSLCPKLWHLCPLGLPAAGSFYSEQLEALAQIAFCDAVDYGPAIAATGRIARYCDEHRAFDGITMPTRRRAYRLDAERNPRKA
jgi:hypothetical protein